MMLKFLIKGAKIKMVCGYYETCREAARLEGRAGSGSDAQDYIDEFCSINGGGCDKRDEHEAYEMKERLTAGGTV